MSFTKNDSSIQFSFGKLENEILAACAALDEKQVGKLLFRKDPHLWKANTAEAKEISQSLGWLTLPNHFTKHSDDLKAFASTIKAAGYKQAVVLGMGGSSLCSQVTRETFSPAKGYPELYVLDNTDPAAILELEDKIDLAKTLFIVASKSGNTLETLCFFHYFYLRLQTENVANPGDNFIAITDAGTSLVDLAEEHKFRKVFLNPFGIGGRYSVLSDFGLVPMALMGVDIHAFLSSAWQMESSIASASASNNPGISLGVLLGVCQKHGRDKVTFVLSSSINSFGYWVEQLLAESTGKKDSGLIPVNGEAIGAPEVYGPDRVFIHICLSSDQNEADERKIKGLEEAGHPVVRIKIEDNIALGGEYYRWEIATSIAGMIMDINPFDQPNVEESKKNTNQLLEAWGKGGSFEKPTPFLSDGNISIYGGKKTEQLAGVRNKSFGDFLNQFTGAAKANDYIALLPYFLLTDHRHEVLQRWRMHLRDELKVATTLLEGPRYLHSTGQLHKGGPDTGLFVLLIGDDEKDLPIPTKEFGFATLHRAQALGDFRSLDDKGRRVIRIHLGKDIDAGLDKLYQSVKQAK
jgi:transaldolase/glucose-6-phosphate isomerase